MSQDSPQRPDAVCWPKHPEPLANNLQRESAVLTAERLLQIDPSSRELAWVRDQRTYFFATRGKHDTEFHHVDSPLARQPRYRWELQPDGSKLGYLIDAAQAD